jgi:hypothetical protein
MSSEETKFYSTLAAVIKPSEQFKQCAEAVLNDIDEKSGVEVLTPSRSRLRFPSSWKRVYSYYETEYLPKVWLLIRLEVSLGRSADCEQIFSDSFRSLFNKDEITKATEPQLCSCRNGYFTFRKATVLSVFIIFGVRSRMSIQVEKRDDATESVLIDECNSGVVLIIQGRCDLRFSGGGEILLASMTYQKESRDDAE